MMHAESPGFLAELCVTPGSGCQSSALDHCDLLRFLRKGGKRKRDTEKRERYSSPFIHYQVNLGQTTVKKLARCKLKSMCLGQRKNDEKMTLI